MKFSIHFVLMAGLAFFAAALNGAETIDDTLKRAALEYGQRLRQANDELAQTRDRIAKEKAPVLQLIRAAEDRIIAAETEVTRLETAEERATETRRKFVKEADQIRTGENYLNTVGNDSLTAYETGLLPGEKQLHAAKLERLREQFTDQATRTGAQKSADVAAMMLEQVQQLLGGYRMTGTALIDGENRVVTGTYGFAGPEAFFRSGEGNVAGTVRVRDGNGRPVVHPLPEWKAAKVEAFFQGRPGTLLADASGGKALKLKETKGTVWQHVNKGGVVSYAIIAVGFLAVLLIGQKIFDLTRMKVDRPQRVQRCMEAISTQPATEARAAVQQLKPTARELFSAGLQNKDESKDVLEERLTAVLLQQRLHYERRLPMLAVIATAAPLMGLLGTVTGMVKTFTLITVFGTGNAGKLASGISEVLVATELGLVVAIPTLVAHGFLSQRIQKNLSLLERYALELVTVLQIRKNRNLAAEKIST